MPWFIFSHVWHAGTQADYLGLTIDEPSGRTDGAGRAVRGTSYFAVRFDSSAAPWSYASLHRAVTEISLPLNTDGRPSQYRALQLNPAPFDPAELADVIERHGFDRVATATASVLAGAVDIVNAQVPDQTAKLEFLDAVAALLPYGLRTDFSAGTQTTSPQHHLRAVFTAHPRRGAHRLDWTSPRTPASGAAATYLNLLTTATQGGNNDRVAALIDRLAADRTPVHFGDQIQALASLNSAARTVAPSGPVASASPARPTAKSVAASRAERRSSDDRSPAVGTSAPAGMAASRGLPALSWRLKQHRARPPTANAPPPAYGHRRSPELGR